MTDNGDGPTGSNRRLGRRSILLGAGGTIVGIGGVAGASNVLAGENSKGAGEESKSKGSGDDSAAATAQFQGVHHNEAVLRDHDMDMAFSNRMRLAADPAGGEKDGVVHVTSGGEETQDSAVTGIDLRGEGLTLGAVSEPGSITYDYFKGREATYQVPDEVLLILQTPDGRVFVTYRKADAEQAGVWETRDVSSEFSHDGWRAIEIDAQDIDFEDEKVRVTTEAIRDNIMAIRRQETYADVVDRFGAKTSVLAVAIANGSLDGVVTDAYFDNSKVAETSYTVPATLTMEPTITSQRGRGGGRITVSLEFADDEYGVSVDDIDPESVRITPYSSFAPPVPGTGEPDAVALADDASVSGTTLEAEFVPGQIQRFVQGNRPTTVLVFGGFEEDPYRFVGVGELEGVGGGN